MPASNHPKMKSAYTLFPEKVMLVPYESIVGDTPLIKSFGDINKSNSIIFNENTDAHDISISEDGIEVSNGRDSVSIQQLDQGGIGDIDDRTTSRNVSIVINTNGVNHDILAIRDGLNPLEDISNNLRFSKDGLIGSIKSITSSSDGDLDMDDVSGIPITVNNSGSGGTGLSATVDIVGNSVSKINITDNGSGYESAPTLEFDSSNQDFLDASYASGPMPSINFAGQGVNAGDVTFTFNTIDLVVTFNGNEDQQKVYDVIKQASIDDAAFPLVISSDKARAKVPGESEEGTLTFVDTDMVGMSYGGSPVTQVEIDTSSMPQLSAVVDTGVASSAVLRSGTIVKQKWFVIMVCDISEEGGDKYYACSPRCVISDDEDFNTSMNGEKRTNTIPLKGLKIQSESELTTLKNAISKAITDKYNMLFAWNAGDTKYEEV